MQRFFIFDSERCFGCGGCVAACVNANETTAKVMWRTVHKLPPHEGDHHTVYISMSCNHCENPACVNGCPTNALEKRVSDGVVIHHKEKCVGCRYCQMTCPYGAPKWDETQHIISKCHFCFERLDQGGEPACVETCFGGAIKQILIANDDELKTYFKEQEGFIYMEKTKPALRFVTPAKDEKENG